jgi:acyl carrier protein
VAAALSEISAVVRELLRDRDLDLSSTTRFEDLVGWDFMDLIATVVETELRYDLQFELQEIDSLVTVGDLVEMIETKRAVALA